MGEINWEDVKDMFEEEEDTLGLLTETAHGDEYRELVEEGLDFPFHIQTTVID